MKRVILNSWERKDIYSLFSQVDYPFYSVTFPMDITNLKAAAKIMGISSYHTLVWACTNACNRIPEFRYRIINGELIDTEVTDPSFTVMAKGRRDFHIITIPWEKDLRSFCFHAKERASQQKVFLEINSERENLIYFSCLPWFDFTSLTNERSFDRDDMIPRIAWGKYYTEQGKVMVHMSVEVNHRTIDGYHIGLFKENLDSIISEMKAYTGGKMPDALLQEITEL